MRRFRGIAWLIAGSPFGFLAIQALGAPPVAKAAPVISYERDVKPILKGRCYSCHSPGSIRGGLDLSTFKGVSSMVKPKNPGGSELIRRLRGLDGEDQMPLGFKALESAQIKLISEWIQQGALAGKAAEVHWAYRPITKPAVPKLNSTWIANPIDAFILKRLRKEGLKPSAPARPETLLRRISLDLNGLPPTLAELDRFTAGQESYPAALDRLLASPHYGEKMAVGWLDLARYADSNGYEKDGERTAWKYRDWVIDAFNRNLPYDQFTIEQLAGDLLPKPTQDQLVATGFNRNTMLNLEGGVDQEEAMYEVRNDRVGTTATVWLGQTLACARCHDHKYDPFSQKDYFRSYAFFANNKIVKYGDPKISEQKFTEVEIPVPSRSQQAQIDSLTLRLKQAEAELAAKQSEIQAELAQWRKSDPKPSWQAAPIVGETAGLKINGNEAWATANPDTVTYELAITAPAGTKAVRIEALPDASLPNRGPGRASSGNFILSKASIAGAKISEATVDFTQDGYSAAAVLDEDPETGWAIAGGYGKRHAIVLELAEPVSGEIRLRLEFGSRQWVKHTLGHFAISASTLPVSQRVEVPEDIRKLLDAANPTEAQQAQILNWYTGVAEISRSVRTRLAQDKRALAQVRAEIPTALIMQEDKGLTRAAVRHRGEFLSPRETVWSATPSALGPVAAGNRLGLAKWIVNRRNPLAARVQMNRLWEMLFGRGLVETSENFGTQGAKPSHPELLDWLAATYMESGWDTKKMLRLIMSSNTYRQTSVATPKVLKLDPTNVLLARGPRFRLPAETIRDVAMQASGLLNPKLGGPPVFPFQPEGVWDSPYSGERWMPSKLEDAHRRSIYTFWKRTAPYPNFVAFDATSREQCTVRRIRTNSPLQALATLNDPGLFEAASALGTRFGQMPAPINAKLRQAFRAVVSRSPKPQELARLEKLHAKTKSARGDVAAWKLIGNVLLNLDEAITKE